MKPTDPAVLARIRARAVRCRLGYGGRAWVTSDPKSEVVEDRMWLLEYIDQQSRATNLLREQLQIAADAFRSLGCAVDADDCEEAIKESLSGGNPGEPKACTLAEERGIVGATGAGQHPDGDGESTRDSAERRSPDDTTGPSSPDESNRQSLLDRAVKACPYCERTASNDGSINHAGGCVGLEEIRMNRLQYDALRRHPHEPADSQVDQMSLPDDPAALKRIVGRHVRWRSTALGLLQRVVAESVEIGTWREIVEFIEQSNSRLVQSGQPSTKSETP